MHIFLALKLPSEENASATDCFPEVKMSVTQLFCPLLRSLEENTSNPTQHVTSKENVCTRAHDDHKHGNILFCLFHFYILSKLLRQFFYLSPHTSNKLPLLWIFVISSTVQARNSP